MCSSKPMSMWYTHNLDIKNPLHVFNFDEFQTPINCAIENQEQITSYNWLGDKHSPIIVVPGAPREFFDNQTKLMLHRDMGHRFVDRNMENMFQRPLDPLFYACDNLNEHKINYQEIEIVTDRSNLTKLFIALSPKLWTPTEPFRFEIRRLGNCILFFSNVEHLRENVYSTEPAYGVDFKNSFTKTANSIVSGPYMQISKFNLAKLRIMMRFEVDCVESNDTIQHQVIPFSKPEELPDTNLKIIRWGVNESRRLIELRTRDYNKEVQPKMWIVFLLSGISKFIMAHVLRNPNDNDICKIKHISKIELKQDKRIRIDELYLLHNCLKKIVDFMRDKDTNKAFYLLWKPEKPNEFEIFEAVNTLFCCDVSDYVKSLITYY